MPLFTPFRLLPESVMSESLDSLPEATGAVGVVDPGASVPANCHAGIDGLPVNAGREGGVDVPDADTGGPRLKSKVFSDFNSC